MEDNLENECNIPCKIIQAIAKWRVIAVVDAAVEESNYGGFWILINQDNKSQKVNTLGSNRWENSTVVAAEARIILNIVKTVCKAIKYLNRSRIVFYNNNKWLIKKLVYEFERTVEFAQDAVVVICEIRELCSKLII